jgi:hypothetical protein
VAVLAELEPNKNDQFFSHELMFFLGGGSGSGRVSWGVAVVGWEWYRCIEEIKAVGMIPNSAW